MGGLQPNHDCIDEDQPDDDPVKQGILNDLRSPAAITDDSVRDVHETGNLLSS